MIIIDHERCGMRCEFGSLEEAKQALRECGYDAEFEASGNRIIDNDGEVVGYELVASDIALCDQISQTTDSHGWSIDNGNGYAEWRLTPTLGHRVLLGRERETGDGTDHQSVAVEVAAGVITVLQTYTETEMTMAQLTDLLESPFSETCWSDETTQIKWVKG